MIRPSALRVEDRVIFAGQAHTVVAFSGTTMRLLSDAGETTVVALSYLLAAEDFELIGAAPAPRVESVGLLEAMPEHVVAAAREWERHLVELETGLPPGAAADARPRPEYDPMTQTMAAREKAKAAELTAAGSKTGVRTVQRMRARYRDQGLWGLVDTRSARAAKPTGHVDERVVAAAATVVAAQIGTRRAPDRGRSVRSVNCSTTSTVRVWWSCRRRQRVIGCSRCCRRGGTRSGRR